MSAPKHTPKFVLREHTDSSYSIIHVFETFEERARYTCALIFGTDEVDSDHAEEWSKYKQDLEEDGEVRFEGDPGLDWFMALGGEGTDEGKNKAEIADLRQRYAEAIEALKDVARYLPDPGHSVHGQTCHEHAMCRARTAVARSSSAPAAAPAKDDASFRALVKEAVIEAIDDRAERGVPVHSSLHSLMQIVLTPEERGELIYDTRSLGPHSDGGALATQVEKKGSCT